MKELLENYVLEGELLNILSYPEPVLVQKAAVVEVGGRRQAVDRFQLVVGNTRKTGKRNEKISLFRFGWLDDVSLCLCFFRPGQGEDEGCVLGSVRILGR